MNLLNTPNVATSHLLLQVIAPCVKAYLYTWGEARLTCETERIPAKIEELDIGYIDGMLLLPLVEEHTIDERSPLCGHTHQSLIEVSALQVQLNQISPRHSSSAAWQAMRLYIIVNLLRHACTVKSPNEMHPGSASP